MEHQFRTPKANHRSKAGFERIKDPQKISKKCLNSAFKSVSEDVSLELRKDSIDISSITEISDDNQLVESAESVITTQSHLNSPSPEMVAFSELSTLSLSITGNSDEAGDISDGHCISPSVEAEMVMKYLKQARLQVINTTNIDRKSKKILDALIAGVIKELKAFPEDKNQFAELVSIKTGVVFLSFFVWLVAVLLVFLPIFGLRSSFDELLPT
ncbi:hypothetical protein NMG60_11032983 [Bertholletia excelsa]